jgi:hypothetical protein
MVGRPRRRGWLRHAWCGARMGAMSLTGCPVNPGNRGDRRVAAGNEISTAKVTAT